ncbi:MAG: hypothetical protein AAB503_01220 [Patescibacteria group bacterium]
MNIIKPVVEIIKKIGISFGMHKALTLKGQDVKILKNLMRKITEADRVELLSFVEHLENAVRKAIEKRLQEPSIDESKQGMNANLLTRLFIVIDDEEKKKKIFKLLSQLDDESFEGIISFLAGHPRIWIEKVGKFVSSSVVQSNDALGNALAPLAEKLKKRSEENRKNKRFGI